jgi:formamidopyrimidine-DNA glycosylase
MPELPEVETTRRGVEPRVVGRAIRALRVHEPRLRWRVAASLPAKVQGATVLGALRRAKYLLFPLDGAALGGAAPEGAAPWAPAALLVHLGMSGNLRVLPTDAPRLPHDHFDLELDSGETLRFNDPRRFGSLHLVEGDPAQHPLLRHLGPEPLEDGFDGATLWRASRKRRVAIKQFIMDAKVVVGVGNIYASEALFHARIRPGRQAGGLTRADCERLAAAIRMVLAKAIEVGGTTLRDYVGVDGNPGYFRQKLFVYERIGEPCRQCGTAVRQRVQGQRSTYWCPACQS